MNQTVCNDSQLVKQVKVAISGNYPSMVDEQVTKILSALGKNPEMLQIGIQCGKKRIYVPLVDVHERYADSLLVHDGDRWNIDSANLTLTCSGKDWALNPAGAPEKKSKK